MAYLKNFGRVMGIVVVAMSFVTAVFYTLEALRSAYQHLLGADKYDGRAANLAMVTFLLLIATISSVVYTYFAQKRTK